MRKSPEVLRIGIRSSHLAEQKTRSLLKRLRETFPTFEFEVIPFPSADDSGTNTDLFANRPECFDRDSFDALREGRLDGLLLDVEETPDTRLPGLDWFRLRWPLDRNSVGFVFRGHDARWLWLRTFFLKAVTFVGAGSGRAGLCTVEGVEALRRCDVCLHDSLIDHDLLNELSDFAERIPVGKRCGHRGTDLQSKTDLLLHQARKGKRVVRLKGGDCGVFARLTEEIEILDRHRIPYRVVPGVSSLAVATTGTGLLLTGRGISRGFSVLTPRRSDSKTVSVSAEARAELPCVFFMAGHVLPEVVEHLLDDGLPPDTPAAVVIEAGGYRERIVRATLCTIEKRYFDCAPSSQTSIGKVMPFSCSKQPAGDIEKPVSSPSLLIVGKLARFGFKEWGALQGRRILLTCDKQRIKRVAGMIHDFGGKPIAFTQNRIEPIPEAVQSIGKVSHYDWVLLSSRFAVRRFVDCLKKARLDLRSVPGVIACGKETLNELRRVGLMPHAKSDFRPGEGLFLNFAGGAEISAGERVLLASPGERLPELERFLLDRGAVVEEFPIYRYKPIQHDELPCFDAVLFSAREDMRAFINQWGNGSLQRKAVLVWGAEARKEAMEQKIPMTACSERDKFETALLSFSAQCVNTALNGLNPSKAEEESEREGKRRSSFGIESLYFAQSRTNC